MATTKEQRMAQLKQAVWNSKPRGHGFLCDPCVRFTERFKCNKPQDCDCPKCQGYCKCSEFNI